MRKVLLAKTKIYKLSQSFGFYKQPQARSTVPKERNIPASIYYAFDSAEKINLIIEAFVVVLKWSLLTKEKWNPEGIHLFCHVKQRAK